MPEAIVAECTILKHNFSASSESLYFPTFLANTKTLMIAFDTEVWLDVSVICNETENITHFLSCQVQIKIVRF